MITYKVIKSDDYKVSNWSGGITRQVYIYPEDKDYANRDFDFRISSAVIELEESDFTKLDYKRHLMLLEGEIMIEHKPEAYKKLVPFEVDTFEGTADTRSIGKCIDFNVMYADKWDSQVVPEYKSNVIEANDGEFIYLLSLCDDLEVACKKGNEVSFFETVANGNSIMIHADSYDGFAVSISSEKGQANKPIAILVKLKKVSSC